MVLVRDNEYEWWFMTDGRLMAPISAAFLYGYFLLDCCCGKLNYPLCGSVLSDLWSSVCVCALMHAGCDSRNLCGFGIFCACSRVF